ncbi:hypothetical protein L207DRAFT_543622 [Hyaloscypha variabilis F]|uniref:Glycoprotease family protein n=1 Tax=Hyaloscypha variabilis (strain UAMH 11265 / GT02V1 / F) TaxID=1149755 RepID=A0A2J6RSM8_HYAVF|nr:hypothetical protein L207DRAFT_543622 [Hyaloscypha variabilis F]
MSTKVPVGQEPRQLKNIPSTEAADNPFDTIFDDDGDDAGDEWWEEEDTTALHPPTETSDVRITQWPKPPEGVGLGLTTKSLNRTSTRKPVKRYSVQKPTRDKSKGRQRKQNAKAGIKVVTNFSRHQAAVPPVQLQPSRTAPQMGRFVDLAALQALNGDSTQTSTGFWKSKKGREIFGGANTAALVTKNPPQISAGNPSHQTSREPNSSESRSRNTLAPSPLKSSGDLSPDDRPIVIGISIPSGDVQEHTFSPQTALSDTTKIVRSYENRSPIPPETPTIIITPAKEVSCWSPDTMSASTDPRPASSIYSQAAHHDRSYSYSNAPPVPQMPASFLEDERQRLAAQKSFFSPDSDDVTTWGEEDDIDGDATKSRVVSTCTVFEEDDSPIMTRSAHSVSISPDSRAGRHASISTVATRPRSKGWWNYITTPFLTRSNTFANRDVENEAPPALPNLAIAAAKALEAERDRRSWAKESSPMTPEASATTIASDPWWDLDAKKQDMSPVLHETRHKVQTSTDGLPIIHPETAGFGSAATMTPMVSEEASGLSRNNTHSTLKTDSQAGINEREVPLLMDAPARRSQNNNSFVQPRLGDFDEPPAQTINRQTPQPETAANPPPTQPINSPSGAPPPPYSPSPARVRYRAVFPPGHALANQYPMSPGPISPGLAQAMSSQGAIPMSEAGLPFTTEALQAPSKKAKKAEAKRRRHEKEDAVAHKAGGLWRGRACIPESGCYGRKGAEGRKKRRCYLGLIIGFLFMIIIVVALATTLHRKTDTNVGPSQWLNLTGFPPIYLGLSTVIAPANNVINTGCVLPATQWSCSVPKELQGSISPNQPNQPNFFLEIQWDNSSSANATFSNVTGNPNLETRAVGNPVSAGQVIRNIILKARQAVTFIPIPAPPSYAEEFFLGNTTDGIVSDNKAGEPTPFYISFVSTIPTKSKRDITIQQRDSDPFPNITDSIPPPSLNADGTAAPANLLPFPTQQPIRLYDRGLPTEHYGFYNYFDRSIFLKSLDVLNSTDTPEVPDDENGGATEAEAAFRCTWSQTRFLVQMWTRMNGTSQLLNSTSHLSSTNQTYLTQPGSFPYPITITTDRHGGDPALKMIYCYTMNDREGIVAGSEKLNEESRGFGGTIINPAPTVFSNSSDPSLGGFDGGSGGCSCQWSNFQTVIHSS